MINTIFGMGDLTAKYLLANWFWIFLAMASFGRLLTSKAMVLVQLHLIQTLNNKASLTCVVHCFVIG